jgi:hypothetical protein
MAAVLFVALPTQHTGQVWTGRRKILSIKAVVSFFCINFATPFGALIEF